jgi:hypothetical protein
MIDTDLLFAAKRSLKKCTREFGGRKGPNSIGKIGVAGVLRLRATRDVSCDKSVRRSAQDDGFVGILTKFLGNSPLAGWASFRKPVLQALRTASRALSEEQLGILQNCEYSAATHGRSKISPGQ